jgi:archaellum component FlaC
MPSKRKHLTLEQKKQLIADNDAGKSVEDLVKKFDASKSGVYKVIGERKSILKQFEDGTDIVEPPPISIAEVSKALDILQSFMEQNADYEAVKLMDKVEKTLDSI